MEDFLYIQIAGNSVWRWCLFCLALLCSLVLGRLSGYLLQQSYRRNLAKNREWHAVFLKSLSRPMPLLWFGLTVYIAVHVQLILPTLFVGAFSTASRILLVVAFGYSLFCMVDILDYKLNKLAGKTTTKVDDILVPMIGKTLRVTVAVLVVMQVAQDLSGKPLTSIIAGLGVGGLAVALAGQDTIKNIFGALVIIADRPFEIGDRIVIDGFDGPVESVGFRSTKLRTLDGHLVSVPNSSLVNTTIRNIGKRPFIKHVANVGVTYDTPPEKMDEALSIIKEILANHEGMKADMPPRVYFNALNDWSLNILVIFWYHPPDYWRYMAFVEKFNLQLLQKFNAAGISFAFPSQTLYLEKQTGG